MALGNGIKYGNERTVSTKHNTSGLPNTKYVDHHNHDGIALHYELATVYG